MKCFKNPNLYITFLGRPSQSYLYSCLKLGKYLTVDMLCRPNYLDFRGGGRGISSLLVWIVCSSPEAVNKMTVSFLCGNYLCIQLFGLGLQTEMESVVESGYQTSL